MIAPGKKILQPQISAETLALVQDLKTDILHRIGVSATAFPMFIPVSEATQVVSGINHFVKIQTENNINNRSYIHATIFVQPNGSKSVTKVSINNGFNDPL